MNEQKGNKILDNSSFQRPCEKWYMLQFQMIPDFCSSRRNIDFFESKDISILPLINSLDFIKNKKSWGYPFRFGFLEINQYDFDLILSQMVSENYDKEN